MFPSLCLFLLCAILIFFSCGLFVNGIEWLGRKLKLGSSATGSVLAAIGTALPEGAIAFMAVAFGLTAEEKSIGIGAAIGGPLVLSTLAYSAVGLVLVFKKRSPNGADFLLTDDFKSIRRNQFSFFVVFVLNFGIGLFAFGFKPLLGWLVLAAYGLYVAREIKSVDEAPLDLAVEPLKFQRNETDPSMAWVVFQVLTALVIIATTSHLFIDQITYISLAMGVAPHIAALFLCPLATELPKIINAAIWVRRGKVRLALANISGSMMIQATVPSALGIFFTPWIFDGPLAIAAGVTASAIGLLWFIFRKSQVDSRKLAKVGLLYVLFLGYMVWR